MENDNLIDEDSIDNEEQKKSEIEYSNKQDKKILTNMIFVILSNFVQLLAGVLVGFVIPKIMDVTDYGYYKTFTLYFGYTGLFHLGFCDGIYLYFAGKNYDTLDKEKFRFYSKFLFVFQTIVLAVVTCVAACFAGTEYMPIFMFVGFCLLANNVTTYYQMISQITYRFKELSIINSLKSIMTIIAIVVLFLLYRFTDIGDIKYYIYTSIFTGIYYIFTFFYIFAYRDITFGKTAKYSIIKDDIKLFFKIGFPLLLANLVSSLLLNVDRQFVQILYSPEEFAMYAFAYNLLQLITTAVVAVSTVLYPSIKTKDYNYLQKNYKLLISIVIIIVSLCLIGYFPLCMVVIYFLPKYNDSLVIFKIVYPGLIYSSLVSIVLANYYKALKNVKQFFVISTITLVVSIVADLISYLIFKSMEAISFSSVIVLLLYYVATDFYISKKMNLKNYKNLIFSVIMVSFFYLCVYLKIEFYWQFIMFFIGNISLILMFYIKEIKGFISRRF